MLLILCGHSMLAHADVIPLQDYFVESWTTKDGLPHNSINAIAQTPEGYLWFGTWEGIARYNGREFRFFERGEKTGLPDSGIQTFSLESDGHMLVAGARGGLAEVADDQWQGFTPAPTMINGLLRAVNGDLWLGMEGKGVIKRPALHVTTSQYDEFKLQNLSAYKLIQDSHQNIWIATDRGVYRQSAHSTDLTLTGLDGLRVFTILQDGMGRILAGSEKGLWLWNGEKFTLLHPDLAHEAVSSLLSDDQLNLWVGTINHGLFRLGSLGLEHLTNDSTVLKNRILSLYEDHEHSIWIGTNAGLFRLRKAPFATLSTLQGLSGNYVRAILPQEDNSVYVGTSTGLNRLSRKYILTYDWPENETPPSVLSLVRDPQGILWVGTYTDGLLQLQGEHLKQVNTTKNGLSSNEVRAILIDHVGNRWVGTTNGLDCFYPDGTVRHFTRKDGLPANFVMALAEDSQQRIWVGTGVGVAVLERGKFRNIDISKLDGAEYVFGFYAEPHHMWLTTDRGLIRYRFKDEQISIVGRRAGLPIDKMFQVIPDKLGAFWLTTNRGMLRISQQDANAVADGTRKTLSFEHFGESDGMLSAQANGGSNPAGALAPDGSVWIATARGAVVVHPERLMDFSKTPLNAVIESVETTTQQVIRHRLIRLSPGTQRLTIRYAGLGYIMPQRIQYSTRLEGFENHWIDRQNQTVAEYTNLVPGTYTFAVKASYPYGDWSGKIATLTIIVEPFYWQRAEFQFLMFMFALACIAVLLRVRLNQLHRREAQLQLLVQAKTQQLQQQAEDFERQAREDQLTGLDNRRAFDEQLRLVFSEAKNSHHPMTMAILDIDHFKQINDQWSHLLGDRVLCQIADTLRNHTPPGVRVARWGGEEFTLLFPMMNADTATQCCEILRETIAQTDYDAIAPSLKVTASFGVCDSQGLVHYQELIRRADQALYQAKTMGRNQVVRCQENSRD